MKNERERERERESYQNLDLSEFTNGIVFSV